MTTSVPGSSVSTASAMVSPAALAQARSTRYAARKRVNQIALTLSLGAMAFGVFWLVWILWETLRLGLGGLSLTLFTEMTPPPNEAGGLANALFGSATMVALATFAPLEPRFLAHPLPLVRRQAAALGLPHLLVTIEAPFEQSYETALSRLRQEWALDGVVTGDIDISMISLPAAARSRSTASGGSTNEVGSWFR